MKWLKWIFPVAGVVLFMAWGMFHVLFHVPGKRIEAARQSLRSQGRPVDLQDLFPEDVPQDRNAAGLYREAIWLFEGLEVDGAKAGEVVNESRWARDRGETDPRFDRLMASPEWERISTLLIRAAEFPACNFGYDYGRGMELIMPEVAPILGMANCLREGMIRSAERGDVEAVLEMKRAAFSLVQPFEREPALMGQLVRIATVKLLITSLKDTAPGWWDREEVLAEIEQNFGDLDFRSTYFMAMEAERVAMLDASRRPGFSAEWMTDQNTGEVVDFLSEHFGFLTFELDRALYLDTSSEWAVQLSKPYADLDLQRFEDELEEIPVFCGYSRDLLGSFLQVRGSFAVITADLHLTLLAMDLFRHRNRTGEFPEDLSQFPADSIRDPCSGSPFRYERTVAGFRLYSVGKNKVDDGGREERLSGADDLLWEFPPGRGK